MTWKMKRAALVVTLVAALGPACKKAPETAAAPTATAERTAKASGSAGAEGAYDVAPRLAHPLLWSAEKAGTTTYFLGTMHAGIDADSRLPEMVWSKLDAARAFAMEADLDDPEAASLLRPTTSSLRTALGDDYWKKLEHAIGPAMAGAVEHRPPLVPAAQLSLRGLPPTVAMDKALSARAHSDHKPIVYLERATHQLQILGKWMDVRALKMMLDELPESERRAKAMLDAYVEGNDQTIVAISDREKDSALQHGYSAAEYDQEMNEMLYDRNASWIDAIEKLHASGGAFVAVGAMHLVGPRSVLELLAHRGYQVKRVASAAASP
jgi:uncharacterized protein YbaP (TraB family)